MIYLNVDEQGYLLSVARMGGGIGAKLDIEAYDLTGYRIRAHKWDGEALIFDADRYAELEVQMEAERQAAEKPTEAKQLRADVDYIAIMTGVDLT